MGKERSATWNDGFAIVLVEFLNFFF